jgi:transposase
MKPPRRRIDVNLEELDRVLDGARQAPLSEADHDKLKDALHAMAAILARSRNTEKTSAVVEPAQEHEEAADVSRLSRPDMGGTAPRRSPARLRWRFHIRALSTAPATRNAGVGTCTCRRRPSSGARCRAAPLAATVYSLERLRCGTCGHVFTAQAPEGVGAEKYDETAAAVIAQLKYGSGIPFYRQERLEQQLGVPLPAATQWEMVEEEGEVIKPARDELMRQAAQGEVLHNDDTGMRVLKLERESGDQRTGVFTKVRFHAAGRQIALYFTGRQHAGENIADVLKHPARESGPANQMCDALSWNAPKLPAGVELLVGHCLATADGRSWRWRKTSPWSAGMCWNNWARCTATMPGHARPA